MKIYKTTEASNYLGVSMNVIVTNVNQKEK